MSDGVLRAWWLPLLAALLSLFTLHASYLLSAAWGHVPWCWPWWDSCTSISATGRQLPAKLLFKPLLTLSALLVLATFWVVVHWLRSLDDEAARAHRLLLGSALVAAVCIIVYTAALGEAGDTARLLRRLGVTTGFALSFFAELLVLARLAALRRRDPSRVAAGPFRWMFAIMLALIGLGLLNVGWQLVGTGYNRVDDALEWQFALLVNAWLLPLAVLLRRSDVRLQFLAGPVPK